MISWVKPGIISKDHQAYPPLVLFNVLIVTFLSVFATVATIIADDAIQGALALSDRTTAWLTTINLLGINTVVPASSWFADRFGYKTMFAFGIALFSFASLCAGLSNHFTMICASRLFEGIGSGFIFPIGLAILMQNLPAKRLPLALILYIASAFGAGFAVGLPLAGYFTQFVSWRAIFFLIAPIGFLGFIFCALLQEETERKKTARFDFWGFLCFATFISSFLIALTYGPMDSTSAGWRSPFILGCFLIALISLLATIYIEKHHENPLIPISLFHNPIYSVSCLAMFLLGMSIFASVGTMMHYMINALFYERFVSGKIGIIYGVPLALCSVIASVLMKKIPVPIISFFGFSLLIYSYFLNNILDWQTGPDQILLILLLRGIGLGMALGPVTVQALSSVPPEFSNKAATLLTFFRQVGGTYGGTLISIIVIKRKIFHAARFGEQANSQLPGFQVSYQKLFSHYQSTFFDQGEKSSALAKATLVRNIEIQAYIQAINDAMIIFGYVTIVVALVLVALSIHNWHKSRKKAKLSA